MRKSDKLYSGFPSTPGGAAAGRIRLHPILLSMLIMMVVFHQAPARTAETADGGKAVARLKEGDLGKIRFGQNLGAQLPGETALVDQMGQPVRLEQYFNKSPVILIFGYFRCAMLCGLVLDGLVESLQQVKVPSEGGLYQLVFVSIDPDETPADAVSLRNRYVKRLGHPPSGRDWHFLTGPAEVTKRIAGIVGFDYALDEASGEYAHPAGFVVLTPQGRIARYFFGVSFSARELASVIRDAGQGTLGARIKEFVLLCFHYSPLKGRYSREVMQVVRIGGICTLIGLGAVLYRSSRSRRRTLNKGGET